MGVNPANTVELLRASAKRGSAYITDEDIALMQRAADLIQMQQDGLAEQSHQIDALQQKVHLCAGYDQLVEENERLLDRLDRIRNLLDAAIHGELNALTADIREVIGIVVEDQRPDDAA